MMLKRAPRVGLALLTVTLGCGAAVKDGAIVQPAAQTLVAQ